MLSWVYCRIQSREQSWSPEVQRPCAFSLHLKDPWALLSADNQGWHTDLSGSCEKSGDVSAKTQFYYCLHLLNRLAHRTYDSTILTSLAFSFSASWSTVTSSSAFISILSIYALSSWSTPQLSHFWHCGHPTLSFLPCLYSSFSPWLDTAFTVYEFCLHHERIFSDN